MEILGIGPLELLFIVLIALIVLGPKDMVKAGRSLGRALKAIVTSDTWRVVTQASREMRNLPNRLIREANLEDIEKQLPKMSEIEQQTGFDEIKKGLMQYQPGDISAWTTPPSGAAPTSITTPEAGLLGAAAVDDQADQTASDDQPENTGASPTEGTQADIQSGKSQPPGADDPEGTEKPAPEERKGNDRA